MIKNNLSNIFHDICYKVENCKCVTYVNSVKSIIVTYSDMRQQVEDFYNCLRKTVEKIEGKFIGIISDELNPEIISIIIGILKSNNAFVCLDTTSDTNVNSVCTILDISYIICRNNVMNKQSFLNEPINLSAVINIFGSDFEIWKLETKNRNADTIPFNYAFAVFSSGSTGFPKIIKVPHDSIVPNILDLRKIYELQSTDTMYISTPMTFDPCIMDIFLAFSSGSCVFLANNEIKFNPEYISKFFSHEYYNVTVWYTTPSLFLKWFPRFIENTSLRILTLGGESFPNLNLKTWPFLKNVELYNIYGVTEVSCWASVYHVTNFEDTVALGYPLSDTIFQVRNDNGSVITEGEGELCIGSESRICFVDDETPLLKDKPFFRTTGDVVNIINGNYYFVGRKDRRIKLYGHQIDLTLLEKKILGHASVKCCCCIYVEDEEKIISLVELVNDNLSVQHIETFIKSQLPSFMLPDILFIPQIPLNKHGKVSENSCKTLYLHLKKNENVRITFESLWTKYTTQLFDTKIDENRGFIQSGGNSFTALQFASALTDISVVHNDFLSFLLSDKSYLDCMRLIKMNTKTELINSSVLDKKHRPINLEDGFTELDKNTSWECSSNSLNKKFKTETELNKLNYVVCKGRILQLEKLKYSERLLGISEVKVKWKYDLEKCVDASPTLAIFKDDAFVICGSHSGCIIVANIESGKIVSGTKLPDRIESSACVSSCGNTIFIGCYDKKMYCLDINDCHIKWHFQTDDIVKSTPVFHNNRIFFGSYDHYFYCLCSANGSLLWKIKIDEFPIYATAAIKRNIIIICTLGGSIAFIELNGTIKNKIVFGQPFFSNPAVIFDQDLCVFVDVTGVVRLFDTNLFLQLWHYEVHGNVFSSISISYSETVTIIFGCHDKSIYCFEISEKTGHLLWKKEVNAPVYSTPFICEKIGSSAENDSKEVAVVASTLGDIFVLDSLKGNILTRYSVGQAVYSSPVVFNSHILVGSRDNHLYCLSFL